MTLSGGSRLGSYEIVAPLGAGGMGEVYRARDTKLGREVAIKVLPSGVASDPDRRARFEQEARSASSLNHPNILTIYDVAASDGTIYIAMELIEGKTLRELIASGEPVPMRRLLDVATQTAEGLAKAHAAGIVHRDLKPENLMVSKDGFVKILDFGLAKLIEPVSQEQSALPTAAAPTTPGTVMGTAGYMSPEQASGQAVDYRSDQFTLGAILYEMATGIRAFQRKTGAETLVAIMREEPEPLSQLAPRTPAPVRWIVERLLAKDPDERYASTRDLARDLKSVRDHLSETTTSASGALEAAEPARARRRGWALPAILALLLGTAAGLLLRPLLLRPAAAAPVRFQRLTFQRGRIYSARFAPDGQTIVYSAAWDGGPMETFSTRSDSSEYRSLGLSGAAVLSVSTAGELAVSLNHHFLIGYQTTGTLARVPLAGGAPREILEDVQDADWAPDGKTLAVCRTVGNRSRIEYPIGKVIFEPAVWASGVRISPDGRHLAFLDHPQGGNNDGYLKIIDTSGALVVTGPFVQGVGALAWSPDGSEVWYAGIQATSLQGKSRQVWSAPSAGIQDVARDGKVLFDDSPGRRELIGVAGPGAPQKNLTALNWSFPTDISAATGTVLFYEQQVAPPAIYIRKLDGSPAVRIGDGEAYGISPDGKWVVSVKLPDRRPVTLLPTGPGEARTVDIGNLTCSWANWFPDGRRLLLAASEPGHGQRLYVQEIAGGRPRPITPERVGLTAQAVSPDGRSIVARAPDGRLAVYPSEPGEPHAIPGLERGDQSSGWTADSRSVFVMKLSGVPGVVQIVDVVTGKRTPWKEFLPPDPTGVEQVGPAIITPDEKAYAYSYRRVLSDLYLATGMR